MGGGELLSLAQQHFQEIQILFLFCAEALCFCLGKLKNSNALRYYLCTESYSFNRQEFLFNIL